MAGMIEMMGGMTLFILAIVFVAAAAGIAYFALPRVRGEKGASALCARDSQRGSGNKETER